MNASDFVNELFTNAPSIESYIASGMTRDVAEDMRSRDICDPRINGNERVSSNELFDLYDGWNVSKVEVGMIRFTGICFENPLGTEVGQVEADPLILLPSNELVVMEYASNGHLLWEVARTPGDFLAAVAAAAKFLNERGCGLIDYNDFGLAQVTAVRCAELAGGEKYRDFYYMLLDAFP